MRVREATDAQDASRCWGEVNDDDDTAVDHEVRGIGAAKAAAVMAAVAGRCEGSGRWFREKWKST
jgi:hypothetical protein